jgi:hypothetical protein
MRLFAIFSKGAGSSERGINGRLYRPFMPRKSLDAEPKRKTVSGGVQGF